MVLILFCIYTIFELCMTEASHMKVFNLKSQKWKVLGFLWKEKTKSNKWIAWTKIFRAAL